MNPRRAMFAAAALIGAATGMSLTGCGGPEGDTAQPAATVASDTNPSYSQQYKTNSVSVSYSESGNGYSINWSNLTSTEDLVYGRGWNASNGNPVYYSGSFSNGCGGCFGIYGWTTGKLVEYYVCDSVGAREGPHNSSSESPQFKCEVVSDGDVYDVYYNLRRNAPNITGTNQDFPQYISVRRTPRTSGTITVQNHFNAWASSACGSMSLGTKERMVLGTEAWGRSACGTASGSAKVTSLVSLSSPYSAAPAQVTGAKVKTWGYSLDFTWNAVSGATGYTVTRAAFDTYNHVYEVVNTPVTGTTYSEMVPNYSQKYQYSVAALNSSGVAGPSAKAVTVLAAPSATLTFSGSTLKITWGAVTGATGYVIDTNCGGNIVSTTSTSYSSTRTSGDWYCLLVKATDGTTPGNAWLTMGFVP